MIGLILIAALGAGETSKHNDNILAYDQAVKRCHDQGQDWKRVQPLVVQHLDADGNTTAITKVVQVICLESAKTATEELVVAWDTPTVGAPLHYVIHLNDAVHTVQSSPWVTQVPTGEYTLTMFAVFEGEVGTVTEPVTFNIKVR